MYKYSLKRLGMASRKLSLLCPSCRALLGSLAPRRLFSSAFDPGHVLVVPKRSRLDYERSRGNLSDAELRSKVGLQTITLSTVQ